MTSLILLIVLIFVTCFARFQAAPVSLDAKFENYDSDEAETIGKNQNVDDNLVLLRLFRDAYHMRDTIATSSADSTFEEEDLATIFDSQKEVLDRVDRKIRDEAMVKSYYEKFPQFRDISLQEEAAPAVAPVVAPVKTRAASYSAPRIPARYMVPPHAKPLPARTYTCFK